MADVIVLQHRKNPVFVISNFRRIDKAHFLASFDVEITRWRLQLCGCTWHRWPETGYERINFPAKEWTGNDGKKRYANLVKFTDDAIDKRFQKALLEVLKEYE